MKVTTKMIDFEMEMLKANTKLPLEYDANSVYGGWQLNVEIGPGIGDISYYRMPKQHFYTMLRAMNRTFDRMRMQEQEVETQ